MGLHHHTGMRATKRADLNAVTVLLDFADLCTGVVEMETLIEDDTSSILERS